MLALSPARAILPVSQTETNSRKVVRSRSRKVKFLIRNVIAVEIAKTSSIWKF